ncbi:MAG: UvrD-helicase domain-containing protein, partial [Fibrobacterales bacterium]|nr:UvrD-helicase domain-containing protein [Fibrobacterales bacterium]
MGLDAETLKRALTRPQYEAVTSDARASLVLAGAGSGKTRVLVYKIARLLQEAAP